MADNEVLVPEPQPMYFRRVEEVFTEAKLTSGEVGVEVEVEGIGLPKELSSYWTVHADNSLRGESAEYVMTKPVSRKYVLNTLEYLEKKLGVAHVNESSRTSVHVHINCQGMTMKQVYTFIVLYLVLEDLMVEFAGPTRVGNVFCLRAKDAEAFVDMLANCLRQGSFAPFNQANNWRYSSVNVCSLPKFNSLEFRALRGTVKSGIINEWVSMLLALKDASALFDNPQDIVLDLSTLGAIPFVRKVFPEGIVEKFVNHNNLFMILMESARLAQEIAFAIKWQRGQGTGTKRFFRTTQTYKDEPPANFIDDLGDPGEVAGGVVRVEPRGWNAPRPLGEVLAEPARRGEPVRFVRDPNNGNLIQVPIGQRAIRVDQVDREEREEVDGGEPDPAPEALPEAVPDRAALDVPFPVRQVDIPIRLAEPVVEAAPPEHEEVERAIAAQNAVMNNWRFLDQPDQWLEQQRAIMDRIGRGEPVRPAPARPARRRP